jgi:hypothetical protein
MLKITEQYPKKTLQYFRKNVQLSERKQFG